MAKNLSSETILWDQVSFPGKKDVFEKDSDVYFSALGMAQEGRQDKRIRAFFLDRYRRVKTVEDFGAIGPEKIDINSFVTQAIQAEATEIFIAQKVAGLTRKQVEYIKRNNPKNRSPEAHFESCDKEQNVRKFITLSKALREKDITLGEVYVYYTHDGFVRYSGVSDTLFPGFSFKLENVSGNVTGSKYDHPQELFKLLKRDIRHVSPDPCENILALFLNNAQKVTKAYKVPTDHSRVIPGLIDERKCLFNPVFKQAVKENANSILLIQNTDEYSPDEADILSCSILKDARASSRIYGVPLTDYIILGGHDDHERKYNALSFVDMYGMK